MPTTSSAVRRPRRALPLAAATAAFLTPFLLMPGAHAAPDDDKPAPEPPAQMSTLGGAKLGNPGTQVDPRAGADAPALPKKLTARSWIISDAESGHVLAAHNAHWELPPASTLKMLFADTLLPKFPKDRKHKVERSDLEGMGQGSSLVGVKEGLTYTVEDLWRGVFLRSGNDAVHVLAAMNDGKAKSVREMNARAEKLRALDTHVVSPDGYDQPGQMSSAYDLSLIARSGMQNEDFRDYASTVRAKFPGKAKKDDKGDKDDKKDEEKGGKKSEKDAKEREYFEIQNTNRLLTGDVGLEPYPGIAGVKNGYTSKAGNTFAGVAERDGRVLLATVMHPEGEQLEVYKEAAKLFDWGFAAADKVRPVGELVPPAGEEPAGGPGEAGGPGKNGDSAPGERSAHTSAASSKDSSGGASVALGITGGALVVLAAGGYVVHRRWPLPDLPRGLRRRPGQD
ncbi:D-alanyl-D-alanine carboxypeptidase [Streptomyces sp. N2-109]|uniref:D-alanyl-D-alanine carboxypeptidase n=1 Tax=Streptomyces gossypii TaxID=2883101 RepID=A0ABT2K2X6_9ACTN|nr:D-alanyl-D-alanine carboxypeptidase [Streptomyces gossypii]MCT2594516.1 D-alanyl-D-alanine carboxypeptidase [Streptomyces gossypii]